MATRRRQLGVDIDVHHKGRVGHRSSLQTCSRKTMRWRSNQDSPRAVRLTQLPSIFTYERLPLHR